MLVHYNGVLVAVLRLEPVQGQLRAWSLKDACTLQTDFRALLKK